MKERAKPGVFHVTNDRRENVTPTEGEYHTI